jgi:aspartyl-tRNA(Asn)/glutamyl-tRNA(Gln) amidotransferase subunit C
MQLSVDEVRKVAMLARLRLSATEEAQLADQLGAILSYVEKLAQVDTMGIEPFSHTLDYSNALRADRVINQANADALLANAPDRDETFFKVPKIIE